MNFHSKNTIICIRSPYIFVENDCESRGFDALYVNVKFTFRSFKIRCFLSVHVISLVENGYYFFDFGADASLGIPSLMRNFRKWLVEQKTKRYIYMNCR